MKCQADPKNKIPLGIFNNEPKSYLGGGVRSMAITFWITRQDPPPAEHSAEESMFAGVSYGKCFGWSVPAGTHLSPLGLLPLSLNASWPNLCRCVSLPCMLLPSSPVLSNEASEVCLLVNGNLLILLFSSGASTPRTIRFPKCHLHFASVFQQATIPQTSLNFFSTSIGQMSWSCQKKNDIQFKERFWNDFRFNSFVAILLAFGWCIPHWTARQSACFHFFLSSKSAGHFKWQQQKKICHIVLFCENLGFGKYIWFLVSNSSLSSMRMSLWYPCCDGRFFGFVE